MAQSQIFSGLSSRCMAALVALAFFANAYAEDGVSSSEISVGATNALTGPIAVCGAVTAGAAAYLKMVNGSGGINGRTIQFQVLDDAYSSQRAIGNVRRLLTDDKVFALFSGCGTATTAAVLTTLENEPIPYLFPFAGLDVLTEPPKKNVFSLLPRYADQLSTILDYIAKSRPDIKTAALSMITIAGHEAWTEAVHTKLAALRIKLVDEQFVEVTLPDKSPSVTQMKSKAPDLLILVDSSPGAARYLIEMQRQDWKPKLVTGISTLSDESFLKVAGPVAEGILIAPALVVPPNDPKAKDCVHAMDTYDKSVQPSSYTMFGCLSAEVFLDALKRTGKSPTREKLIDEVGKTKSFDTGISGTVTFRDDKRQGLDSIFPMGVLNGQFKVLGPPISLP